MITCAKKSIEQEYELQIKKTINKQKQKNQYTKDNKFQEKFLKLDESKQQKLVNFIQMSVPRSIMLDNIFRLKSNVQIPRNADSQYQLGELNIDFYSYNYKINRIDRNGSITTITFDPIQRYFTPVENVIQIIGQGNEELRSSFQKLHNKKLDSSQFIVRNDYDLFQFENAIDKPCTGYISKVFEDKIITQQRFMNDLYLNMIGINSEMVVHYAMETGYLPIPLFFSENNQSVQHLSNFFKLNTFNQNINNMEACNYNGQKFPAKIKLHNYYCYNEKEKCYYEYLFFIWDVDKKWISKQKVLENYQDYFNIKCDPFSQTQIYYNSEQRCGYKQI